MLGRIWGIALLILALYIGTQVIDLEEANEQQVSQKAKVKPNPSHNDQTRLNSEDSSNSESEEEVQQKTDEEIAKELAQICEEMESELKHSKITPLFKEVRLKYHEKRLQTDLMNESLRACFRSSKAAKTNVEFEVFSSDFDGEASDQIQIQVSLYEVKSNEPDQKTKASRIADTNTLSENKIFEIGRKLETQKKIPSLSTRDQK